MPNDIWQRLVKRWPWADNAVTRKWCDETWEETGGDKAAIQRGLDACNWIDSASV